MDAVAFAAAFVVHEGREPTFVVLSTFALQAP
jgi:hypothetical protein